MRVVRRTLLAVFVVVLAGTAWVGVRGYLAYRHLGRVQIDASALQKALTAGDSAQARVLAARVATHAHAADRLTGDPVWALAASVPVVGRDLGVAHVVAEAVDEVAAGALPPLIQVSAMVTARPRTGTGHLLVADLHVLRGACGYLDAASRVLATADAHLADVRASGLVRPLAAAVTALHTKTAQTTATLVTANRVCIAVPAMLDAPTPKSYLLLFQNLAEARSLGGTVGAYAVVRADAGVLTLTAQGSGAGIAQFPRPVLALDPGYQVLFAGQPARFFLDTTTTPYFPDAALLAREMWRRHSGQEVDGVISVDPVALSHLLTATGPVTIPGGLTVTATNAVQALLQDVYARYPDPASQDGVFSRTTTAVFESVVAFRGPPRLLLKALAESAGQHRLLVWDSDPAVERSLAGTVVEGVPAITRRGDAPNVGVYLNEGSGSKLSWYLHDSVTLHPGTRAGRLRGLDVRIDLASGAPVGGLSRYVLGGSRDGTDRVLVLVVAPSGADVVLATVDGRPVALGSGRLHGRGAVTFAVVVAPGGRCTAVVHLLVVSTPGLDLQPLAR